MHFDLGERVYPERFSTLCGRYDAIQGRRSRVDVHRNAHQDAKAVATLFGLRAHSEDQEDAFGAAMSPR